MQCAECVLARRVRHLNKCNNGPKVVVLFWHNVTYPDGDSGTYE